MLAEHPAGSISGAYRDGRRLGALLLIQLAGLIVPFVMIMPAASGDYLTMAADRAGQIRLGLVLLLANAGVTIGVSTWLHGSKVSVGPAAGRWLLMLGGAMLVLQAVDNVHLLGMVAASESYAIANLKGRTTIEIYSAHLATTRHAAHYTTLLIIGSWMLVFYASCWRARLVPRPFALLGLAAATLHLGGVSLPVALGSMPMAEMAMGLAVSHLALAGRLLLRGIGDSTPPLRRTAPSQP